MSQSLSSILVHVVFSTKQRKPMIKDSERDELHAYTGGIVSRLNGTLLRAGSVEDHIHLLVAHPRTCAPADLIQEIKTGFSKWIKTKGRIYEYFHWQSGLRFLPLAPLRQRCEAFFPSIRYHWLYASGAIIGGY
ncbi:MAG: transposase [Pirellula sp.]|nr:transposase [Pirellula sp.]